MLVTDGSLGIGKGSLRNSLQTLKQRGDDKKFPLPFPFPTKLYIMCVANAEEVTSLLMRTLNVNCQWSECTTDHQKHSYLIPFFCTTYFNSCIRMFFSVPGNSKCDSHPFLCVVAVTDERHHEQPGGAPPSQWRRRTDFYCRWSTLHEERTGNVWVWLWDNLITMFSWYLLRNLRWWVLLNFCRRLIDHAYSPFHAVLHCGNLSSDVQVFPRPEPVIIDEEVEPIPQSVNAGIV